MTVVVPSAQGYIIPAKQAAQATVAELESINHFFGGRLDIIHGNQGEVIISTVDEDVAGRLFRVMSDTFGAVGLHPHRINPQYH